MRCAYKFMIESRAPLSAELTLGIDELFVSCNTTDCEEELDWSYVSMDEEDDIVSDFPLIMI